MTPTEIAREQSSIRQAAEYQARVKWTRTDTARFLDDRSEPVLALLRRRGVPGPRELCRMGDWLRVHEPKRFDRAHARLAAAADDDARAALIPTDFLP